MRKQDFKSTYDIMIIVAKLLRRQSQPGLAHVLTNYPTIKLAGGTL